MKKNGEAFAAIVATDERDGIHRVRKFDWRVPMCPICGAI
jgi:hypothetical protein